ncbi:hypothetical protein LTR53_010437 [Teratosphaeriaceae sp. CCFEE 6253]|nr:hypothetical protein LTR53_010437 [Teratosphaeriaceae sp. CCFEE 6253]
MSQERLTGLTLTRGESIIIVALSYLFSAPLFYKHGKTCVLYLSGIITEARRQLNEERDNAGDHQADAQQQQRPAA